MFFKIVYNCSGFDFIKNNLLSRTKLFILDQACRYENIQKKGLDVDLMMCILNDLEPVLCDYLFEFMNYEHREYSEMVSKACCFSIQHTISSLTTHQWTSGNIVMFSMKLLKKLLFDKTSSFFSNIIVFRCVQCKKLVGFVDKDTKKCVFCDD